MMMRMLTLKGNKVSEGMGIEQMTRLLGDMAKANPNATLDDLRETVIVSWPHAHGPGKAIIQRAGQPDEVIPVKPTRTKPGLLSLPAGAVVRLVPDDEAQPGVRFITSPNGELIEQLPGHEGPAPQLQDHTSFKAGSLEQAYTRWISSGEVGASSSALAYHLCYSLNPSSIWTDEASAVDHPLDWSDFGRCIKMLDAIPQLRPELHVTRWMSPAWALIGKSFDRLEQSWRANVPDGASFSEAVIEGLGPAEDRLSDIGRMAVQLQEIADGRALEHGQDLDDVQIRSIKNDLEEKIEIHRGALCFSSRFALSPSKKKRKAAP